MTTPSPVKLIHAPGILMGRDVLDFAATGFFQCKRSGCWHAWQPGKANDGYNEDDDQPARHCPRCYTKALKWHKPIA